MTEGSARMILRSASVTVTVTVNGYPIPCPVGKRLDDLLAAQAPSLAAVMTLPSPRPCGGYGMCGQCRVLVQGPPDSISPPTEDEALHLSAEEMAAGMRLACRTVVLGDCAVITRDRLAITAETEKP